MRMSKSSSVSFAFQLTSRLILATRCPFLNHLWPSTICSTTPSASLKFTSLPFTMENKAGDNLDDEFVRNVLQSGVDLRSYSASLEKELKGVIKDSVMDYVQEAPRIADLHNQIDGCDKTLERLENILCTFQADLGNICQEILSLQEESVSLNIRLKNKQAVRIELGQFLDDLVVPENVITSIINVPVTEKDFTDSLVILDQKITFVNEHSFSQSAESIRDVNEILTNLKLQAVAKIKEYILKKIQSCRKAMTNYQIPQNALLKNKFFYQFLSRHSPESTKEITSEYIETMSKVYFSYFKEYHHRLNKLKFEEVPDKDDTLGSDDNLKSKSSLLFASSKPSLKNRSTIFTLGDRGKVLTTDLEAPLLVPHTATKMDMKYPLESIFRSLQFAILDNGCREYVFLSEFFILNPESTEYYFHKVFGKTLDLFIKLTEDEFTNCYDSIGLLLCHHIVLRYRQICSKRSVQPLDLYWDALGKIIKPRFELILNLHIKSIINCDISKLTIVDCRPHYITRRYAEFSSAIIAINESYEPKDEKVTSLLEKLQTEVENLILKMAAKFDTPREQMTFQINNYDMILTILMERTKESEFKEFESVKVHLTKRINDFVEELLYPHFGQLISFVKDCEVYIEKKDANSLAREEKKLAKLVKSFNSNWRKAVEQLNQEVMTSFTNFKCGNNIIQRALTQIISYYHRFYKIATQAPFIYNPVKSELMNIHQLMVEIKKYKSTF